MSATGGPGPSADATGATLSQGGLDVGRIDEEFTGRGPRVVILGDSNTAISRAYLQRALDGYTLKIGAVWGEGLGGGPISDVVGDGVMRKAARDYAADRPDVAVIALGTNDAWNPALTLAGALEALDEIVGRFDTARLVGVTVTERSTAEHYDQGAARAINEAVRAAVDVVVDWNLEGASERYTRVEDLIHPTPAGSELYAALVAIAVARCAHELT